MAYQNAVKTAEGNDLLARVIAGETTIQFTKIAISDTPIESFVAKQEQVVIPEKFEKDDKVWVKLFTRFLNTSVIEGYDINTIAIYAKDSDNVEIMFSYLPATEKPVYMDAYNGSVPQPVNIDVEAGIWVDDGSLIVIDDNVFATQAWVKNYIKTKLESETVVTIPADDPEDSPYTEETDSDENTYYTIEINVTGMTSSYKGVRDAKPVYPRPYNVEGKAAIDELFALIQDGDSLEGKIKLYFNEKPDTQFQIYLYGV